MIRLLLVVLLLLQPASVAEAGCNSYWVTGYVATGNLTYYGEEPVPWTTAAAGWDLKHNDHVYFPAMDLTVRINDRGRLGSRHVDIFVNTVREAYDLTGRYRGCVQ